jgi:hypothetical protein
MPGNNLALLEEMKDNTHHYTSVIADAADSQLASLTTTGVVPADVYDNLQETVRPLLGALRGGRVTEVSGVEVTLLSTASQVGGCVKSIVDRGANCDAARTEHHRGGAQRRVRQPAGDGEAFAGKGGGRGC